MNARTIGIALLGIGATLLVLSGAYYAYGAFANAKGDRELNAETERPGGPTAVAAAFTPTSAPATPIPQASATSAPTAVPTAVPTAPPASTPTATGPAPAATPSASATRPPATPAAVPEPTAAPTALSTPAPTVIPTAEGITVVVEPKPEQLQTSGDRMNASVPPPTQHVFATRMMIPAVNLDTAVKELEVVWSGGSAAWENPKFIVGHIPTTAAPADVGQGWYFGHLESPVYNEGNVFQRLPELAQKFYKAQQEKTGEKFEVQLVAGNRLYTYQVYKTEYMHKDKLTVTDSRLQDITLVTCFPQYVYDHRLLVTASLVEVRDLPQTAMSFR